MYYCPRCLREYPDDQVACWPCHARLVLLPDAPAASAAPSVLTAVYHAHDEFSALTMQAVLEEAGVHAAVQSMQMIFAGVAGDAKGHWGRVLVNPVDLEHAREVVREYLGSLER